MTLSNSLQNHLQSVVAQANLKEKKKKGHLEQIARPSETVLWLWISCEAKMISSLAKLFAQLLFTLNAVLAVTSFIQNNIVKCYENKRIMQLHFSWNWFSLQGQILFWCHLHINLFGQNHPWYNTVDVNRLSEIKLAPNACTSFQ